jgi:hypothetical protein
MFCFISFNLIPIAFVISDFLHEAHIDRGDPSLKINNSGTPKDE